MEDVSLFVTMTWYFCRSERPAAIVGDSSGRRHLTKAIGATPPTKVHRKSFDGREPLAEALRPRPPAFPQLYISSEGRRSARSTTRRRSTGRSTTPPVKARSTTRRRPGQAHAGNQSGELSPHRGRFGGDDGPGGHGLFRLCAARISLRGEGNDEERGLRVFGLVVTN